jgi:hydroxymethylpyrimidine pyrophosphatase-like HAD family hydrolase
MKFSVLALDYDGTIATDGILAPEIRIVIGELRAQGIVVLLVTGRNLDDLRRVAGDLHFVDSVVAENGAVIQFSASGYSTLLTEPPDSHFLDELEREHIFFKCGQAIVEIDAVEAPRVLTIIRRLELPLVLLFNRSRLMVLPQTISKATGLREALTILRLSTHNTVAIGDAENDHELLQACEVGVAVGWGSEALKSSADYVLAGSGPTVVAEYIRALAQKCKVPVKPRTRNRLLLGYTDEGCPLALAVCGRNVLVTGDSKSGKSWVVGLLCEQLILYGYCLCIVDPEGDYTSLEALPGVTVFGGVDPLPRPRDLLRALRHPDVSVVVDLSHTPHEEKLDYLRTLLPSLAKIRRLTGLPHRIVLDEAHYFLHERSASEMLDLELNGYTLVTYRASTLCPEILQSSEAVLVTRESDPKEVRGLLSLCRACAGGQSEEEWQAILGGLILGEALVLPITKEAEGRMRRIRLAPRLTPHVRHFAKYIDIPVPEARAFVFWRDRTPAGLLARTMREFVAVLEHAGPEIFDGHLRRHDFSRWIAEVFGDYPLAAQVRAAESAYSADSRVDVRGKLSEIVRSRYEFTAHARQIGLISA